MWTLIALGALVALLAGAVLYGYGPTTIGDIGTSVEVSVDGNPEDKVGGITLDWSSVTAVSGSDVTWNDGVVIKIGQKGLRYGQVVVLITASGKYGPYDPGAADGRQTLAIGKCFILNRTAIEIEPKDEYPEAIHGGRVWIARILNTGGGAHTLAGGPTLAELMAAFPRLQPVYSP